MGFWVTWEKKIELLKQSNKEEIKSSILQGTWEHGKRQGVCRIEKSLNGVAFIDGNYQDDKMNGKVNSCSQRNLSTLSCRWWSSSRTTHGWRGSSRTGSFMASVAISTPRAVWPLWGCTGMENPSAPAGRSVDGIWGQLSFFWLTLWQKRNLVRTLEKVKIFRRWFTVGSRKGW